MPKSPKMFLKIAKTALIQINMGSNNNLNKFSSLNAGSLIDTQIALMRTQYILEPVVVQYGLNILGNSLNT